MKKDAIDQKYSMIRFESSDEKDLIVEAEKYDHIWWMKIDSVYFNYLRALLSITTEGSDYEGYYSFYYQGLQGHINIVQPDRTIAARKYGFYSIWLWWDECEANIRFWNDIMQYGDFVKQGLHTALDPNHGGTWDARTKEMASIIIYG